jgi:hypothetical protein
MRRLTRREYNHSVAQLLGDTSQPANALPTDAQNEAGFASPIAVSTLEARLYGDIAEAVAGRAVKDLGKLAPCDAKVGDRAGEDACARRFIEGFGRRAYRRPLEASEVTDLFGVYDSTRKLTLDHATGVSLVLQAILQSPKFLYRWEVAPSAKLGRDGAYVRLTPHQVASRLSFFLWGAGPDDALLDAADQGQLATPEQVVAQGKRLLGVGGKASDAVGDFHRQWLRLDGPAGLADLSKSKSKVPAWTDDARPAIKAELDAFAASVFVGPQADGKLATLLTAPVGFVRESTAPFYDLTDVKGTTMVRKELNVAQRAGVFTQLAFLSVHATSSGSHPTKRGTVVWRDLLCGALGKLPDNVPPVKEAGTNVSALRTADDGEVLG